MRSIIILFLCIFLINTAVAAPWRECKTQKLESMRLEKALRKGRMLKGYSNRSAMRQERRRLDDWLWKNCRRYSSELRDLYAESL